VPDRVHSARSNDPALPTPGLTFDLPFWILPALAARRDVRNSSTAGVRLVELESLGDRWQQEVVRRSELAKHCQPQTAQALISALAGRLTAPLGLEQSRCLRT
jgi:hypothetical protein